MRTYRSGFTQLSLLAALSISALGCGAVDDPTTATRGRQSFGPADAVARAEQWAAARLQYCQAPNHQRDYDNACSTYCNRTDNPEWDPYRSDCSGLISWAWGLPAPGRITTEFAPFVSDITSVIDASSLAAGDAVNNADHIMLFKGWVVPGARATFIEEPGCSTAITYAHEFTSDVSLSGTHLHVNYVGMNFSAIRYNGFGGAGPSSGGGGCVPGGLYCGGDKVQGDAGTLYRCNGGGAPSVVEVCAAGCQVNAGRDDSCASSSGAVGNDCVPGGLYCGGDKVSGDAGTLYRCNGPGAATVVQVCAGGCQVNAGRNDSCGGGAVGNDCVPGGLYCGGDKVSGDAGTLYRCNGPGAATVVQVCAGGCQVNAGRNDSCGAVGNNCVPGGLYCGGDKVSGDTSTLYRCNGPGAATVIQVCASGCRVNLGVNDSCR